MAPLNLTPLASLRVSSHHIPAHPSLHIPNSSLLNKPLLIYHSCFPSNSGTSPIQQHLRKTNVVEPQWTYSMFPTTHYHSTTHEVLCVANGRALLCFGGEDNPDKVEAELGAGDVIVVPAGVGHRLLEDKEGSFQMVGSYPVDSEQWDMCYGKKGEKKEEIEQRIKGLKWFCRDPLYGDKGPVLDV